MKSFIVVLVFVFIFLNQNTYIDLKQFKRTSVTVEIKGEVTTPGIYELDYNAKVKDLIDQSGGLLDTADISGINQSKNLRNQDVIVIEKKQEQNKVSINGASLDQLCSIPGVGPSTAQKIIDYREEFGPFQTIEDIQKVAGIKEKTYLKMKDYIRL
ncbi:ComEA family DNA-binding protein [Breznakia pachnodae]|uniref:Competence protein ComEA n=1 Tax=Breznakia pachnodae TaxID=265178 RepID=A0ABU0E7L9_9FIRM|nr:ComEA family DNA-binding protein [Breznakia pachnodae]MDQ0362894.1 competence protein ComEA [Breznakia pachnodae]